MDAYVEPANDSFLEKNQLPKLQRVSFFVQNRFPKLQSLPRREVRPHVEPENRSRRHIHRHVGSTKLMQMGQPTRFRLRSKLTPQLFCAFGEENDRYGAPENSDIKPDRPVVDIFQIKTHPIFEIADLIASADLPEARYSGLHA
ncbi:MAG: hypothetical protein JWM68_5304 [Verrucomicrobiales bacterium]|nr:hypothetical protein [Verrucomicrobiales bacterium]